MIVGQGQMEANEHGTKRESNVGRGRFDLIPYEALEALAIWYEQGAEKYDERNWEQGISVKDCINRMCRHSGKVASGWTDENHLAAVMWNAAAAITMMKRKPECNDHTWMAEEKTNDILFAGDAPVALFNHDEALKITDDDRLFLSTAIESGGIYDLNTLCAWVNRRINK